MPGKATPPDRRRSRRPDSRGATVTAVKRLALATACGGTACSPLFMSAALGRAPSAGVVLASSLAAVAVTLGSVVGPRLATLLWTAMYSRMMTALVRKGIAFAQDTDDVRHLMAELRDAQPSLVLCEQRPRLVEKATSDTSLHWPGSGVDPDIGD